LIEPVSLEPTGNFDGNDGDDGTDQENDGNGESDDQDGNGDEDDDGTGKDGNDQANISFGNDNSMDNTEDINDQGNGDQAEEEESEPKAEEEQIEEAEPEQEPEEEEFEPEIEEEKEPSDDGNGPNEYGTYGDEPIVHSRRMHSPENSRSPSPSRTGTDTDKSRRTLDGYGVPSKPYDPSLISSSEPGDRDAFADKLRDKLGKIQSKIPPRKNKSDPRGKKFGGKFGPEDIGSKNSAQ
jgi:hypothetical protein